MADAAQKPDKSKSTVSQGLDAQSLSFIHDEEADLKKQQQDIDTQIGEGEELMKQQRKAAQDLDTDQPPALPKLEAAPAAPKPEPNDFKHVAWATILLSIVGIAIGGIGGLAAMAGGLQGLKQGRKDKLDQSMQDWKNQMDVVADHNAQIMEQYRAVEQASEFTHEQKLAKYNAIAAANKDFMTLQSLRDKRYDITAKILDAREKAITVVKNSDPTILGSSAWRAQLDNLRGRLDKLDGQKKDAVNEQDRNESRIANIRNDLQNQLLLERDPDKQAKLQADAQKQIDAIEARNNKLDEQINALSQKAVPYQTRLDKMLDIDSGYEVNPEVGQMMVKAGAKTGDVTKYQGKAYRLEDDGAHEITDDEYNKAAVGGVK